MRLPDEGRNNLLPDHLRIGGTEVCREPIGQSCHGEHDGETTSTTSPSEGPHTTSGPPNIPGPPFLAPSPAPWVSLLSGPESPAPAVEPASLPPELLLCLLTRPLEGPLLLNRRPVLIRVLLLELAPALLRTECVPWLVRDVGPGGRV